MQPIAKAIFTVGKVARYTFLMDPPVPARYYRNDLTPLKGSTIKYVRMPFRECLRIAYHYVFKRAPVFTAGTWVGSKMIWAIEEARGEDATLYYKNPFMWASGFAALFFTYHRSDIARYLKTPVYAFGMAFTLVWFAESFIINKRGLDAFWNPLHLRLPAPAVAVLAGDPFNGEFIIGPLKYAASSAIDSLAFAGYSLVRAITPSADPKPHTEDSSKRPAIGSTIEQRIAFLEEQALVNHGFIDYRNTKTMEEVEASQDRNARLLEEFDQSVLNYLNIVDQNPHRLSHNTARLVENIFVDTAMQVMSPTRIAHSPSQAIFGNLHDGIIQSMDPNFVASVRRELFENSNQQHRPRRLGVAQDPGYFATERIRRASITEHAIADPIAWLMSPFVSFVHWLYGPTSALGHFLRGHQLSFDDRKPSSTYVSMGAPEYVDVQQSFEGADNLPVPYELPPLIPQDTAERQVARISESREHGKDVWAERYTSLADTVDRAIIQSSTALIDWSADRLAAAPTTKKFITQMVTGRSNVADAISLRNLPESEFEQVIHDSADHSFAGLHPEGIPAEARLKKFVENVGGRDFDEPSEFVRSLKAPRSPSFFRRQLRIRTLPSLGERMRSAAEGLATSTVQIFEQRAQMVSDAVSGSTESPATQINRVHDEDARNTLGNLERKLSFINNRWEKEVFTPARTWFDNMKQRWTKD